MINEDRSTTHPAGGSVNSDCFWAFQSILAGFAVVVYEKNIWKRRSRYLDSPLIDVGSPMLIVANHIDDIRFIYLLSWYAAAGPGFPRRGRGCQKLSLRYKLIILKIKKIRPGTHPWYPLPLGSANDMLQLQCQIYIVKYWIRAAIGPTSFFMQFW